jgi:hypothetical protein
MLSITEASHSVIQFSHTSSVSSEELSLLACKMGFPRSISGGSVLNVNPVNIKLRKS